MLQRWKMGFPLHFLSVLFMCQKAAALSLGRSYFFGLSNFPSTLYFQGLWKFVCHFKNVSYLFLTGLTFLGGLRVAFQQSSAIVHLSVCLLFHGWFLKHHLHLITMHRMHNLDSSGRITASLFLNKCFITPLANTQWEGSAKWLCLNPWTGPQLLRTSKLCGEQRWKSEV